MTEIEKVTDYIYSIPKFAKKGGLSQTAQLMALFGDPQTSFNYIHIAGTNGKGSVSAYLDNMLRECGVRTGLFTSPHLVKINERMKVNGEDIHDGDFIRIFFAVKSKIDDWMAHGGVHPTFFEWIYLMAMLWFKEQGVETAVVETGMGGRLDSTNIVRHPAACVITSIGYDHMQYLGNTLEAISGEKAGIIKAGTPLIYDASSAPEAVEVIKARAKHLNIGAIPVEKEEIRAVKADHHSISYQIQPRAQRAETINIRLHTPALYQCMNSALALRTMEVLFKQRQWFGGNEKLFYEHLCRALWNTVWPGRFEAVTPRLFIDGAHNDAGIKALCRTLTQSFGTEKIYILFAVAEDKDYTDMIRHICGLSNLAGVMVTAIESERKTPVEKVEKIFRENGNCLIRGTYNIKEALEEALCWTDGGGMLVCTGSLYLAGSLKALEEG